MKKEKWETITLQNCDDYAGKVIKIDIGFLKREIQNQFEDKMENMEFSEISEELHVFLKDKKEVVCRCVYEVLINNEYVIQDDFHSLKAQDGFCDNLILSWDHICVLEEQEKEEEILSTILYNYDALWMTGIHKAFPQNTTPIQCGWGMMELIS